MLPAPTLLHWPAAALPPPEGDEADLWWIDPALLGELGPRPRARQLLHDLLSAYLGGATPQFGREAKGRPFLRNPGAPDFNLSDTRGGTVLAVAGTGRLGVDLERMDRTLDVGRLAARWFAADEAAALARLDQEAAGSAFLRLWTAKEAACKATGTGIFGWLPAWRFEVAAEQPHPLAAPEHAGSLDRWRFQRIEPEPGYSCVVAAWDCAPRWRYFLRLLPG